MGILYPDATFSKVVGGYSISERGASGVFYLGLGNARPFGSVKTNVFHAFFVSVLERAKLKWTNMCQKCTGLYSSFLKTKVYFCAENYSQGSKVVTASQCSLFMPHKRSQPKIRMTE